MFSTLEFNSPPGSASIIPLMEDELLSPGDKMEYLARALDARQGKRLDEELPNEYGGFKNFILRLISEDKPDLSEEFEKHFSDSFATYKLLHTLMEQL